MRLPARLAFLLACLLPAVLLVPTAAVAEDVDPSQIFFPIQVQSSLQYTDSYGDCRSGCNRSHLGVDLMSDQMVPVFAAQNGTIYAYEGDCAKGEYCSSYYLLLDGDDGRMYFYVHLNNDTPGRPNGCDGTGGAENAFAPRLVEALRQGGLKGLRVERGEHIAFNGSSGNAGCRVDHVHFEVWQGEGWSGHGAGQGSLNPYPIVRAAQDAGNVWGPGWTPATPAPSTRVAGATRIDTAIELSRKAFPDGAETVVIAPATYYQEALVAAPLAATTGSPVLLAWPDANDTRDAVPDELVAEIDRLGAEYAVVVGAPRRIGNEVVDELAAKTAIAPENIQRIGDADPAVLSAQVAEVVLAAQGITLPPEEASASTSAEDPEDDGSAIDDLIPPLQQRVQTRQRAAEDGATPAPVDPLLAAGVHPQGLGWPDALAASVLGARQLAPVLLTPSDELHPAVARVLRAEGIREARIVGGEQAVTENVREQVEADTGRTTARMAGEDRYRTSQVVAAALQADGAVLDTLSVATGLNFPDALAAGPALALLDRAFVLVDGRQVHPAVQSWISERAADIDQLEVIGGPDAIADEVLREAALAANEDQREA